MGTEPINESYGLAIWYIYVTLLLSFTVMNLDILDDNVNGDILKFEPLFNFTIYTTIVGILNIILTQIISKGTINGTRIFKLLYVTSNNIYALYHSLCILSQVVSLFILFTILSYHYEDSTVVSTIRLLYCPIYTIMIIIVVIYIYLL